jgi:hypothetical protein
MFQAVERRLLEPGSAALVRRAARTTESTMSTFRRPAVRPRAHFTLPAAAIALLTLGAGAASAAVLATGPIFSSNASLVDCLVVNVSSAPVTVLSAAIYNQAGQPASGSNGCTGASLQPNGRCIILPRRARGVRPRAARFRAPSRTAVRGARWRRRSRDGDPAVVRRRIARLARRHGIDLAGDGIADVDRIDALAEAVTDPRGHR